MKKTIIILACMLATAMATAQEHNFTINGTNLPRKIKNGKTIVLCDIQNNDSVGSGIIKKGNFTINGNTDTVFMGYITDRHQLFIPITIEPYMTASIDVRNYVVGGSPLNDQLNRYVHGYMYCKKQRDNAYYFGPKREEERFQDSINAFHEVSGWQIFNDNADNVVGAYVLYNLFSGIVNRGDYYSDTVSHRRKMVDSIYATSSPVVRNFLLNRQVYEKSQHQQAVAIGKQFVDFAGIDRASHDTVSLSRLISGHVAIVDFWASWCGPCRQEIKQYLKPLYEKYSDSGLVIVGVGVWDNENNFDKAINDLELPYSQLIDLTGKTASSLYGFVSIPQVFLIDRNGTMLGKYRGEELVRETETALKKQYVPSQISSAQ